jgi:hypothetical protein
MRSWTLCRALVQRGILKTMATLTMRKQRRGMRRNLKSWILAIALLIALVTTIVVASVFVPLSQDGTPGTRDEVLAGGVSEAPGADPVVNEDGTIILWDLQ